MTSTSSRWGPRLRTSSSAAARPASHLAPLDGLRFVGALMVVTTHVTYASGDAVRGPFAGLFARLDAGVALFFVVSGFLLYRPHVRARLGTASAAESARTRDTWAYARHRVARIVPASWLAVTAAALLLPHPGVTPDAYLRIASMTQIYSPQPTVPGLTQMWSLSTEVAFYVVLPVVAALLARLGGRNGSSSWSRRALVVLATTPVWSLAWTALTHDLLSGTPNLWLPAYVGWFGAGMALAVWREGRLSGAFDRGWVDDLVAAPGTLWSLAAAGYVLLSTRFAGPYGLLPATPLEATTKSLGYTVLAALVVLPCVSAEPTGSRVVAALASRPARVLGDISYGVFAYHLVALGLVERALHHVPFAGDAVPMWLATLVIVLPVAWLSHRVVERPVIRLARRGDRRPDRPAAAIGGG